MSRFIHISSLCFLLFAFNNSILLAQKVYICEGFTYNIDSLEVNQLQNGFKEGVWIDKGKKGNLRSLITYNENVKNGLYIEFYLSGKVKNKGCYTFVDDALAENWVWIDKSEFNIVSVAQNYVTQIVNMQRNGDEYNINSVTDFSIKIDEVQTRQEKTWWGGTKDVKFRTLTVTETTQHYENNQKSGSATSKTYTTEEIVK